MKLLVHFDPRTLEPLGVWRLVGGNPPELFYAHADGRAYAESVIADARTNDWQDFAQYLTERTPYSAWWEFAETDRGAEDELQHLRRQWAGVTGSTTSPRFEAAARRLRFHRLHAERLAEQVLGETAKPFEAERRVSATVSLWVSSDDERLAVIVGPGEKPRDVDAALAYGLTFQGDRDLHLVIPDGDVAIAGIGEVPGCRATCHRAAHIATPVYVWTHAETDEVIWSKPARAASPEIVPPRYEVLAATRLDDELKVGEHDLGDRADWVHQLRALAEGELDLDFAPRWSYLAWHTQGRQVLKVKRSNVGLQVTAGTDYSAHRTDKTMATVLDLDGPPGQSELAVIREAIETSARERDDGADGENLEHLLQSLLATPDGVAQLGLVGNLEREVPVSRPSQRRAYIDLLGVDARGDIHVIETKIDSDPMLALQGLDYWVWANEHRLDLVDLLRSRGHNVSENAAIRLDYVIGTKADTGTPDLRYVAPQLEALDGSISWRVALVEGWRSPDTQVQVNWSARRTIPSGDGVKTTRRFAHRLQDHLVEHHDQPTSGPHSLFLPDPEAALPPAARPAYQKLASAGLLHRFFSHVRSSQQFAVALFGGLRGDALVAVARRFEPAITSVSAIDFEYQDPRDLLGESSPASKHTTQADVAIHASLGDGRRHLILIEVKLSEDDFGHCTGYQDPDNDRPAGCLDPRAFEQGPAACFKLANHNRGGERTYNFYVGAEATATTAGCPFRTSNNQPMRNVALAQALVDASEFDEATVALCAHDQHRAMWRRWDDFKATATTRDVALGDLPASAVLGELTPDVATPLADRYAVSYRSDDAQRLLDAIDRAQMILQRVAGDGGVLEQVTQNVHDGKVERMTEEQRALAQRLELLAEATRSARADLVPPLWDR